MKRTVEIEDSLDERVEMAIEEVKKELLNFLDENPDTDEVPDLMNDLDYSGAISEAVDSSVPIHSKEIRDTWYLHCSELEEAYENAGIGKSPRENDGMTAIYCYIHDKVAEWYHNNAEEIFEFWKNGPKEVRENEVPGEA